MQLTNGMVEQLTEWCALNDVLAGVRSKARSDFFGYDEPGTIKYMAEAGEVNGRERCFLGWFGFRFRLPDGKHPADLAAAALLIRASLGTEIDSTDQICYSNSHHGETWQRCLP